ncbi:tyrosine-type recombinase/integrase [Enterococcus faecalis]
MTKKKIDRTTGYNGIYLYDPSATPKRYFIHFRFGKNMNTGKSIVIKRMVGKDKKPIYSLKEAQQFLKELKEEAEKDVKLNYDNHMLFSEFMNRVYIPSYKTDVESSTFLRAEGTLEKIRDRFGHKALKDISALDVQEYRTWLLTPKEDNGAGLAQSTAALTFGMFRKTLDRAVELDYLESNVSKKMKAIPKGKASVPFWTKEEFEKVISQICIDDYYQHLNFIMLWTYFTTGVRVNEACALYWSDIDFEKRTLSIQHMLEIKNKDIWVRKDYTKTESGKRIISLDDDTLQILKDWKIRQSKQCTSKFIFSYDGKPMQKSTIARIIERYSRLAGVHRIQAKGLRHSHASYLINEFNVDILMLSKRLGHSGPEITLRHYSHYYPNRDEIIAENITGNIKIQTSKENQVKFNGNQNIKIDEKN